MSTALVECVMNVSEGRRDDVLASIALAVEECSGAWLLNLSSDRDHNRSVYSFVGSPEGVDEAAFEAIRQAVELIDLRRHSGVHPRIGAADVVPFIPLAEVTRRQAVELTNRLGGRVAAELEVPVYLYEHSATHPRRRNLAWIRRGGFSRLLSEISSDPDRAPDFGPSRLHPSAGACVIGVRDPLVAYNVYLQTEDVDVARKIAGSIRERDGGLPGVKALGLYISTRRQAQVSVNLVDYRRTSLLTLFERIGELAGRQGVNVPSSEVIGLVPREALPEDPARMLKLENYSPAMVLEHRIEQVTGIRL